MTTPEIHLESDALSSAGRAAHDIGLAALLGGNLFARVAMHPALGEIGDERERGRVLNRSWRRYGTVNSLALASVVGGWAGARASETAPGLLSDRERKLATAKDIAVGAVAVTGIASAVAGIGFARTAPSGAVPMQDGDEPAGDASDEASRLKHAASALGWLHLASAVSLASVNAALSQTNFRRPPARRLLRRRY
jgi:hypothetical protein